MTQQQSPFIGVKYGWGYGEDNWNDGMDENLVKFSFMFDGNVDAITNTLPSSPSQGYALFNTTDKKFYYFVNSFWYNSPCPKNFVFKIKATGQFYQFDGTTALQVDNFSELNTRIESVETTVSSLGSAAFEDTSFFASQTALDSVESGAAAYTDSLRNDLSNVTTGASNVGYGGATVSSKLNSVSSEISGLTNKTFGILNVREFGVLADGSDETSKVQLAVNAAISSNNPLYWPPGEVRVTGAIPGFYSVRHTGPGTIKNGGVLPFTPLPNSSVNLYVATTGSDNNLGLSAAQPLNTISAAISAIPVGAVGNWTINIAAGTYSGALTIARGYNPNLNIVVVGPVASSGSQTVIIDGTSAGSSTPGIYIENLAKVSIRHVKVQNFVYSGLYFMGCGFAQIENANVFNCGTSGNELIRNSHGVVVANNCQLDGNNAALNGFVCYHGFLSVTGASTVTKCTGAGVLYAEASGGHFDTNLVSNCGRGVYALQGGFPTISGGSITSCSTAGIESDQGSYIVVVSTPTFSGNGVNIRQTVNTGIAGKIRDETSRTVMFANNDAFEIITQAGGSFIAQFGNSGLTIPGGGWNTRHLLLGSYHIWVDSSGKLRIKNGAPSGDTDGTIVGTQT